ncbi:9024_t:CDS:2, partial [Gigaspora rosea]
MPFFLGRLLEGYNKRSNGRISKTAFGMAVSAMELLFLQDKVIIKDLMAGFQKAALGV